MLFVLQYQRNKEDTKAEESHTSSSFQSLQFHSKINLGFQIHLLFVFFPIINFVSIIHFFNMSANPLFLKEETPEDRRPTKRKVSINCLQVLQRLSGSLFFSIKENQEEYHTTSSFQSFQFHSKINLEFLLPLFVCCSLSQLFISLSCPPIHCIRTNLRRQETY